MMNPEPLSYHPAVVYVRAPLRNGVVASRRALIGLSCAQLGNYHKLDVSDGHANAYMMCLTTYKHNDVV